LSLLKIRGLKQGVLMRFLTTAAIVLAVSLMPAGVSGADSQAVIPAPINSAEAVFEPFWDSDISGISQWAVIAAPGCGFSMRRDWCSSAGFSWSRKPDSGFVARISRVYKSPVECAGYDRLIVCAACPPGSVLKVSCVTDKGHFEKSFPPSDGMPAECEIEINGASLISGLSLELTPGGDGWGEGYINWIGLADTRRLEAYLDDWTKLQRAAGSGKYIRDEKFEPSFTACYNLWFSPSELLEMRGKYEALLRRGTDPLEIKPSDMPEPYVREYLGLSNRRFRRDRDQGQMPLFVKKTAFAGLMKKDKTLLRYSARVAVASAMCRYWDTGFMCHFPAGAFEQRSFSQTAALVALVFAVDCAGEMLTDAGRDLILRKIAEHGLGNVNFVVWKHDYIKRCNQLSAFSAGRIAGYLLLEKCGWKGVAPYTDLAMNELSDSVDQLILPDGGFLEGSPYLMYTMSTALPSMRMFASARGKNLMDVIPASLKRSAASAEVFASTAGVDSLLIPVGDSQLDRGYAGQDTLALLASAMPESQWTSMFRKSWAGNPRVMDYTVWPLERDIPASGPPPRPFTNLPDTGVMSSVRALDGAPVKLLVVGGKAEARHNHEDKGSFILEFAGDVFAMDPGGCNYSLSGASVMRHCQSHNMLVPVSGLERPAPLNPLRADVKPSGSGDGSMFSAEMDISPSWKDWFAVWKRKWRSSSPDTLFIKDEYRLKKGSGVEFLWLTSLPVTVSGRKAVIIGGDGKCVVEAPADCGVRLETLTLPTGAKINRLVISKDGPAGDIEIKVKLERRGALPPEKA
jgi:hypothetical protein